MSQQKRYPGRDMTEDIANGLEVAEVTGVPTGGDTETSASTMFNEAGDIMVRLDLSNGPIVGARLKIVHTDIRDLFEGHTVLSSDYRAETIHPSSLICGVQADEDSLTVRFDDRENPAFWAEVVIALQTRDAVRRVVSVPEADNLRKLGDVAFIRRVKGWRHRPFLPLTHLWKIDRGIALPAILTAQYVDQPLIFPINLYDTPQFGGEMTPEEIMETAMRYSSVDRMLDDWTVD